MCVHSWSRWADIQKHGHFKHKLEIDDVRTIARAMVRCGAEHTVCQLFDTVLRSE